MHDPLDNPEIAAARRDRGGRSGPIGRIRSNPAGQSSTPRAANSRGVSVFALANIAGASLRQNPPAVTRAVPACRAGLRIVET